MEYAIAVTVVEEAPDLTKSPHPDLDLTIFDPFTKLVQIEVLGQKMQVPENNTLIERFSICRVRANFLWRILLERDVPSMRSDIRRRRRTQTPMPDLLYQSYRRNAYH